MLDPAITSFGYEDPAKNVSYSTKGERKGHNFNIHVKSQQQF